MKIFHLVSALAALLGVRLCAAAPLGEEFRPVLFSESFEDARLLERGWYDGSKFVIADLQPYAGLGCLEYAWKAGGTTPANSSGIRRLFAPAETVYLRCHLRLSKGWGWTGRGYHPHLMHFLTTPYFGPGLLPHEQTLWIDELAVGQQRRNTISKP